MQSKWLLSSFYKLHMKYNSLIIFSQFWLHAENQIYKNLVICIYIYIFSPLTSCNWNLFFIIFNWVNFCIFWAANYDFDTYQGFL
jgi:hypothetical protein